MDGLVGTWKLKESSGSFDAYLQAVGVNFFYRKGGLLVTVYDHISKNGDDWEIKVTSTFKNFGIKFTIDKEFDEHTVDGRDFKSVIRIEDGKMVHYQKSVKAGVPDTTMTRYLQDDNTMVVFFEISGSDLNATRSFSRMKK